MDCPVCSVELEARKAKLREARMRYLSGDDNLGEAALRVGLDLSDLLVVKDAQAWDLAKVAGANGQDEKCRAVITNGVSLNEAYEFYALMAQQVVVTKLREMLGTPSKVRSLDLLNTIKALDAAYALRAKVSSRGTTQTGSSIPDLDKLEPPGEPMEDSLS